MANGVHVARNQIVVVAEGRHAVCPASLAIEKGVLIDVAVEEVLLVVDLIIAPNELDIVIGPAFKRALERLVKIRPAGVDRKEAVFAATLEGAEAMQAVL